MRDLSPHLHKNIITIIEKVPALNATLLRGYNVALRAFADSYRTKTYFGATMICDPADLVQHMILHFGVWEPNTSRVIEGLLARGDVCVDVGANVGYDTLLASHCVGPAGSVIAIEASPSIYELLSRNVDANDTGNVRLVEKAVSDEARVLSLYAGPAGNRGMTTTISSRDLPFEGSVEALPLDQILTSVERSRLKLIKMDIEGAEVPVMRRLLDTLELYPDTLKVLVEVSPSTDWVAVFDAMRRVGFSAYAIENSYSRAWYVTQRHHITPLRSIDHLPAEQTDVLFTRQALSEELSILP